MSLRSRWIYLARRVRESFLRRTGLRALQFSANQRRLTTDLHAGNEHVGRVPVAGVRMIIDPRMYLKWAYVSAPFELPVVFFLSDWLRPGDVFIDVGANVGIFSLLGARLVGLEGRVIAFEPGGFTFDLLERNCRLNEFTWVQCEKRALGASEGQILINEGEPGFDAYTSVGPVVHRSAKSGRFAQHTVQQSIGDSWGAVFPPGGIRLIKIDVEGAELAVLQGFCATLAKGAVDAVLVEITEDMSNACGSSPQQVWDTLGRVGYSWWILRNYGAIVPTANFIQDETMYVALRAGVSVRSS